VESLGLGYGDTVYTAAEGSSIGDSFKAAVLATDKPQAEIILFSGDDYEYVHDWRERIANFWRYAPEDVAICSGHVEALRYWNGILWGGKIGQQHVFERIAVPGACWSFRASLWPVLEPLVPDAHQYDKQVCYRLRDLGYRIYAMPLAEHIGVGRRLWDKGGE
jgi:hypothetical protein